MKNFSAPALAALASGTVIMAGAVQFSFGSTYRLWSGLGALTLADIGDFDGIGAHALIVPVRSEKGEGVDGVRLSLSKLEPAVAASINNEDYQQKPVVIWRCIHDSATHALLDFDTFFRGRVNTVTLRETARAESSIDVFIEGAGLDMGRTNGRVRSNADQRTLGGSTDGGMKHIATAGEVTLRWGQRPETPRELNGGVLGWGGHPGAFGLFSRRRTG